MNLKCVTPRDTHISPFRSERRILNQRVHVLNLPSSAPLAWPCSRAYILTRIIPAEVLTTITGVLNHPVTFVRRVQAHSHRPPRQGARGSHDEERQRICHVGHSSLCQKMHHHHGAPPLIVIPSPRLIILPLPLIRMAVRPRRAREYCNARLMDHISSSSGVQDYLASHLFFQPQLQQLPS